MDQTNTNTLVGSPVVTVCFACQKSCVLSSPITLTDYLPEHIITGLNLCCDTCRIDHTDYFVEREKRDKWYLNVVDWFMDIFNKK